MSARGPTNERGARRLRVGHAGPLPPAPSGIADYAAELLPALAEHVDLELYAPPGLPAPAAGLARRFPVRPLAELAPRAAAGEVDLPLYQLGNHPRFHGAVYRALLEVPGVVVLHEHVLHHMLREITLVAGDPAGYADEMGYAYGRTGRALARRSVDTGVPLDPWSHPLFERAVDAALGVVVHSQATRRRVLASRPGARVRVVPHHLSVGDGADAVTEAGADLEAARAAARGRLGLDPDALLVGTFGYQNPAKRLPVLLRAFARLRADLERAGGPSPLLLVVGDVDRRVEDELGGAGLGEAVRRVGRVDDLGRFLDWMRAVDVAANLRWPTGGETSGTVVRLLGLGRPLVVTDAGAFAEIPDGCAAKVPPGEREEDLLAAYLGLLARDPELRREMGEAARRHAAEHHALGASARRYAEFLREIHTARQSGALALPRPPVAPLVPWPEDDLLTDLVVAVAAAAADLGVGSDEDDLLAPLAEAIVELGFDAVGPQRGAGTGRPDLAVRGRRDGPHVAAGAGGSR